MHAFREAETNRYRPNDCTQIKASLFMRGTLRDLRRRAFKPCIRMNIIITRSATRSATIPSWPKQACSISCQIKAILLHCAHYLLSFLKVPYMNKLEIKCTCRKAPMATPCHTVAVDNDLSTILAFEGHKSVLLLIHSGFPKDAEISIDQHTAEKRLILTWSWYGMDSFKLCMSEHKGSQVTYFLLPWHMTSKGQIYLWPPPSANQ